MLKPEGTKPVRDWNVWSIVLIGIGLFVIVVGIYNWQTGSIHQREVLGKLPPTYEWRTWDIQWNYDYADATNQKDSGIWGLAIGVVLALSGVISLTRKTT